MDENSIDSSQGTQERKGRYTHFMVRAISVIVAVLLLLSVGWFVGHRQVTAIRRGYEHDRAAWHEREVDLVTKANLAEARGMLRLAEAELLLAADDASEKNYGLAGSRARRAQDLIVKAAAVPGVTLPLGDVRNEVQSAQERAEAADSRAADLLRLAAGDLRRILEQSGQA
jgi:hypothetical protein